MIRLSDKNAGQAAWPERKAAARPHALPLLGRQDVADALGAVDDRRSEAGIDIVS